MPKHMRQLWRGKRHHRIGTKRSPESLAPSNRHPTPRAGPPPPPVCPVPPPSPARDRKPAQRRLEPRSHKSVDQQLRITQEIVQCVQPSLIRNSRSDNADGRLIPKTLQRDRSLTLNLRGAPQQEIRTISPAAASARAATNPSPPLLPFPHSTTMRSAAGYCRRQNFATECQRAP